MEEIQIAQNNDSNSAIKTESFEISQLIAEDVSEWEGAKLIAVWTTVYFKEKIHELDTTWLEVLTHEMCFRTSEEVITTQPTSRLQ